MILVLGEWRDGKVRPVPGNAPHDRPVSRGFVSSKSICDDSLRTTRFPQLPRTRRGPRRAFFKAWQNLSVRCGAKTKPEPGPTASRRSAPAQIEERVGRTTFFSSSTMSSGRLFLDRVGRHQSPSPLHRHTQDNMRFRKAPAKGDISTLPGTRHFYFALTLSLPRLDGVNNKAPSFCPTPLAFRPPSGYTKFSQYGNCGLALIEF